MKKFGMALLAILAVNSAFGANWIGLGKASDNSFTQYIDTASIRKLTFTYPYTNNQIVTFFIKRNYLKPQKTISNKLYDYFISQTKGDCQNLSISTMAAAFYTNQGSMVDSVQATFDNWTSIYPDSVGEIGLKSACQLAGYR